MGKLSALISCLLLIVGAVAAQSAPVQANERLLPQWLTGLIAVTGFLFLAFISLLVKKAWCDESSRRKNSVESVKENEYVDSNIYETSLDDLRRRNSAEASRENETVTSGSYEKSLDVLRSRDHTNAYDNVVIDSTDEKATAM